MAEVAGFPVASLVDSLVLPCRQGKFYFTWLPGLGAFVSFLPLLSAVAAKFWIGEQMAMRSPDLSGCAVGSSIKSDSLDSGIVVPGEQGPVP